MRPSEFPDYRKYLVREFEVRSQRNPRYSLRAFARDLEVQPSRLSEAMRGQRGLSRDSASRIARNLQLSPSETEYFVAMVEAQHSRSVAGKLKARSECRNLQAMKGFSEVDLDRFKIVADWYHFAIVEMTDTKGFRSNPSWIAKRLGISESQAECAIRRLMNFGFLEKDESGRLKRSLADFSIAGGIPSREIRNHHHQILNKAKDALESVPMELREYAAITMAIDLEKLAEAKEKLKLLRRDFCKSVQRDGEKNSVYCLAVQFFPLERVLEDAGGGSS